MSEDIKELSPLQRAYVALKEMRSKLDAIENAASEPIAIVGMGCRFPGGAKDPDSFWELLREGTDAVKEVPADRWNIDAYYDPNPETPGKTYTREGGFLDKIDEFDAEFFDISPREAVSMDPQQRLLLEVSWEALESAGTPPDKFSGSQTGVFVGISVNEYAQLALSDNATDIDVYAATGNALSVAAGRLSYNLGLVGPALAVDTACSSSLVAVHLACSSLRSKECDRAIAGGVYLMQSPLTIIAMSKLRALSGDGRCKTFDAAADGYGRGEGCGMVVLKRLSDAIADGDNVLATIRGSAVNQDGRSSGLTVPNARAQERVIRAALENAKVEPDEISYVEAHGTGTSLGDPLEVKTLFKVLRNSNLMAGSVKTNIGHLEAAAGIASLIKVVLAMQHGEIPPHLHFTNLNPHIAEAGVSFTIPTKLTPWLPGNNGKLFAGISSFGFSGTNSHLILESPPPPKVKVARPGKVSDSVVAASPRAVKVARPGKVSDSVVAASPRAVKVARPGKVSDSVVAASPRAVKETSAPGKVSDSVVAASPRAVKETSAGVGETLHLLTLSAKTKTAMAELASRYGRYLETHPEVELGDICFTAYTGRSHFEHRLAVIGSSHKEIAAQLLAKDISTQSVESKKQGNRQELLSELARTYMEGADIDWKELDGDYQRQRVQLPTYPFQRQRYWLDVARPGKTSLQGLAEAERQKLDRDSIPHNGISHPLLDKRLFSPLEQIQFESQFRLDRLPLVGDHCMDGMPMVNLVVYLEMVLAAAREVFGENPPESYRWENVSVGRALIMPETDSQIVQLILSFPGETRVTFEIFSFSKGIETVSLDPTSLATTMLPGPSTRNWTAHSSGELCFSKLPAREKIQSELTLEELLAEFPEKFPEKISSLEFYPMLEKRGVQLGKSCQLLDTIWRGDGEAIGKIKLQENLWSDRGYLFPLGAIDAWIQILSACFPPEIPQMYLIVALESFQFYGYSTQQLWGRAKLDIDKNVDKYEEIIYGDLWLFDDTGVLVAEITKAQLKQVSFEALRRTEKSSNKTARPRRQSQISKEAVFAIAPTERPHLLEKYLIQELAVALQSSESKISSSQPLATLVDSLMAFELRNRIETDLQLRLPIESFLGESNIAELALVLLEQLTLANLTLSEAPANENSEELEEIVL